MESTSFTEGTLASSPAPRQTGGGVAGAPSVPATPEERNTGSSASGGPGDVLLRLEGAPGVRFSGLCSVGDEERVVTGRVPQRYAFDLVGGSSFSCRIQKQSGPGNLRVILLAGGTTRSVQQTNAQGGTITVSYAGR